MVSTPLDIPIVRAAGERRLYAVAALVAKGRTATHRKLGVAGALLALLVVVVATTLAIASARSGASPIGVPPLIFLVIPLVDLVILACIGFDVAKNRRLHPVFAAGFVFVVATQIGRLALSQTPQWMTFAKWLVS
jgi:uncharacterized membrane protein